MATAKQREVRIFCIEQMARVGGVLGQEAREEQVASERWHLP
jgi:hypothetical protein